MMHWNSVWNFFSVLEIDKNILKYFKFMWKSLRNFLEIFKQLEKYHRFIIQFACVVIVYTALRIVLQILWYISNMLNEYIMLFKHSYWHLVWFLVRFKHDTFQIYWNYVLWLTVHFKYFVGNVLSIYYPLQ